MSYSFTITAENKAAAKAAFAHEFAKVVAAQPSHAKEMHAAIATAHACIDALEDDPSHNIYLSANGSVGWNWDRFQNGPADHLRSASISISTHLLPKPVAVMEPTQPESAG